MTITVDIESQIAANVEKKGWFLYFEGVAIRIFRQASANRDLRIGTYVHRLPITDNSPAHILNNAANEQGQ